MASNELLDEAGEELAGSPPHLVIGATAHPLADDPEIEIEVLEIFGDSPDRVRLCCQARLTDEGDRRVTLRVCDD